MGQFFHYTSLGVLSLLPVANPLTSMSLLLSLGHGLSAAERNRQVFKSAIYVGVILLACFYGGSLIMSVFGISLPGLRLAGGLIVCYIGFTMLFPSDQPSEEDAQHAMLSDEEKARPYVRNIAFVPLALPGTAGPGAIALVISMASSINPQERGSLALNLSVFATILIVAGVYWLVLRSSGVIMKALGESGLDAISRLVGFLLIGMGVQFGINGISEAILNFQAG
ncbi:MarC family NAAT transporter [Carnimonas nigrificans]|uniref:MarC family NAAT transporter n=1 Tax=Carnimonas nigrificans TaxID=64323 RepID=UPI0004722AE8|nr:MarC family NAAT transporter [Carnimonas nigrificans]